MRSILAVVLCGFCTLVAAQQGESIEQQKARYLAACEQRHPSDVAACKAEVNRQAKQAEAQRYQQSRRELEAKDRAVLQQSAAEQDKRFERAQQLTR